MCKNTYQSSAFRASKIATDPSDALDHLLRRYLPSLRRLGHNMKEVIGKLVNICYFPTTSDREPFEYKPILKYTYSQTRPSKAQLHPLEITDYHLIPNIPLAPLKELLCYQCPKSTHQHNYIHCPTQTCIMCNSYDTLVSAHLAVPVIPCTRLRMLYLLHQGKDEQGNANSMHMLNVLGNRYVYDDRN
ncbi:hypothetical protein LOD99_6406 [Oopsacas minuta]|uniref:Uncharacterized protein n=1 Tax=Oopsacas minuta TaxID=111878 RepID=A0AAV7JN94_9METZ|nr:hypothetical protein LOD99_6406 [Oopsacas minuta]